jgi:hypothetical protein
VTAHRFKIGQKVELIAASPAQFIPEDEYVVTEQFRHHGELFYCVKNPREPYERILSENRLRVIQLHRRLIHFELSSPRPLDYGKVRQ